MPVHLYGGVPNLNEISKIAKKFNLKIIHDSGEALGSKFDSKYSTNFKDASVISFFPNKIMVNLEKLQALKDSTEYLHSHVGYNYRMPALSAALGGFSNKEN